MMAQKKQSVLRLLLFTAAIALVALVVHRAGLAEYLEQERIRAWVDRLGPWGPLAYIALFAVTPVFLLPGLPMTVAAGWAFGPLWGTVYASVGSTLGASLAFLSARFLARQSVEEMVKGRLREIDEGLKRRGWIYLALTRLIPIFPFNLLNYAFGLTGIRFGTYVLVSWVCMLPATTAYVVFSSSLLDLLHGRFSRELLLGVVLVALITAIPLYYKKRQAGKEGMRDADV
jgi:uncharacterized membrane protein YdjX (TVP38/TMEM64 family)